jgi:hypothetical protein
MSRIANEGLSETLEKIGQAVAKDADKIVKAFSDLFSREAEEISGADS